LIRKVTLRELRNVTVIAGAPVVAPVNVSEQLPWRGGLKSR
jgi:hypothetical protein